MMNNPNRLHFSGEREAHLFFDGLAGTRIQLHLTRSMDVHFEDETGRVTACGASCTLPADGIYRAVLPGDSLGDCQITIEHDEGVMPFLMPSMGVVWNHGGIFPLLLDKECHHTLYALCAFPEKVCCVKDAPGEQAVRLFTADESEVSLDWWPKLGRPWFWMSAELTTQDPWLRIELDAGEKAVRFTLSGCTILSLVKPLRPFRTTHVALNAVDESGDALDVRFELFAGSERVLVHDHLAGETPVFPLPRGCYTLQASQGVRRAKCRQAIRLTEPAQEIGLRLEASLFIPKGWALGELHTHSALEDATLFPKHTMRAARANGLNFCFQTDKDIDELLRQGVSMCDVPGRFIGLPGQEIMCHELHMNVLNTDRAIPNPEADDLTRVNPDIETKIASWLAQIQQMQQERPCTFMLNHPSHRPEVMKKGQPYFRSWWVADVFHDFGLVENFDYEGWFDRLNRGRKLYGAWTGDGHDCMLMHPGQEGVCVHVGDELSAQSIVDALNHGRFFSFRAPGAFLHMNVEGPKAVITARGSLPIERVELIADGAIAASASGDGRKDIRLTLDIPTGARWVLARLKQVGSEWDASTHSFTSLMIGGYDAFTNPIFLD